MMLVVLSAFALALWLPAGPAGASEPSPEALAQVEALMAEKRSRTPVQQKIDSRLLVEAGLRFGNLASRLSPAFRSGVELEAGGLVRLDVEGEISEALQRRVEQLGGEVIYASPRFGTLRALLPLERVENLAESSEVREIHGVMPPVLQMINTTEGDVAHGADQARTTFGVDGTGVTTCAMSDSVEALASLQGSGDLPPGVTVLAGQAGSGTSEGTALLEILHDMAPGADLAFATGQGGEAQMAQNILDLAAFGCDVIV
ncbi:MAG: hypothetical protein MI919_05305, partial [Holophagales bacterium]|nr:hypothetical protein [Holophagales bacterium]